MTIPHFIPTITGSGALARRSESAMENLKPTDSAIHALTDFMVDHPFTVDEERQIDEALDDMIRNGVRSLIVMREGSVTGLITSYDIQGEKPLQFLQNSTYDRHEDVCVGHIMTPLNRWPAIDLPALKALTAIELLRSLRDDGLTHLLVVESGQNTSPLVRGIVSRSRLERQLLGKPHVEGSSGGG